MHRSVSPDAEAAPNTPELRASGSAGFVIAPVVLGFDIGARRLARMVLPLWRRSLSLTEAMAGVKIDLPPLPDGVQGYKLRAVPDDEAQTWLANPQFRPWVRQRYGRCYTDLTLGFDRWFGGLSASTRQGLRRKARRLAEQGGGAIDVRCYRTAEEMAHFFAMARKISSISYQERLLSAGLPADSLAEMQTLAAADAVRGFLLFVHDRPVAYLYAPAAGDVLLYAHLGYDPAMADLSPGSVLQLEAFRLLMAERRFAWFDFTEGGGQHKHSFASGSIPSLDVLLLRPTLSNRARLGALTGFDGAVAMAKRATERLGIGGVRKLLRR